MRTTLAIIKPDAIQRGLVGEIIKRFEDVGLKIAKIKTERLTRKKCEKLYAHLKQKNERIFRVTTEYMSTVPVILLVLEGENAAIKAKQICGATDPAAAPKGTIRGDLGIDSMEHANKEGRPVNNLVHVADPENAKRELKLFGLDS